MGMSEPDSYTVLFTVPCHWQLYRFDHEKRRKLLAYAYLQVLVIVGPLLSHLTTDQRYPKVTKFFLENP